MIVPRAGVVEGCVGHELEWRRSSPVEVPRWIRHPSVQWAIAFQLPFFVFRLFCFVFVRLLVRCFVRLFSFVFVSFRFRSFSFVCGRFRSILFRVVSFSSTYRQLQGNVILIVLRCNKNFEFKKSFDVKKIAVKKRF